MEKPVKQVPRFMPDKVEDRWGAWDTVSHEWYDDKIEKKEEAVKVCEKLNEKYNVNAK